MLLIDLFIIVAYANINYFSHMLFSLAKTELVYTARLMTTNKETIGVTNSIKIEAEKPLQRG